MTPQSLKSVLAHSGKIRSREAVSGVYSVKRPEGPLCSRTSRGLSSFLSSPARNLGKPWVSSHPGRSTPSSKKLGHIWTTRRGKRPTGPETPGLTGLTTARARKHLLLDEPGRKERKTDPGKPETKGDPRGVSPSTLRSQLAASVFWRSVPALTSRTAVSNDPDLLPPSPEQKKTNIVSTIGAMVT